MRRIIVIMSVPADLVQVGVNGFAAYGSVVAFARVVRRKTPRPYRVLPLGFCRQSITLAVVHTADTVGQE